MLCSVQVRNPGVPDEPDGDPFSAHARPARGGPVAFRVPTGVMAAKFGLAALLLVLAVVALISGNTGPLVVGLVTACAVAAYALRDVLVRDRLSADSSGVSLATGYAGRRRLTWAEVEQVRVDS